MLIQIGQFSRGLSDIIKGFFYNYRTFALTRSDHASYPTFAEINYFRNLGEMLNFSTEIEAKRNPSDRPADLVWVDDYNGEYYEDRNLVLHLERETRGWEKVEQTAEKLFKKTNNKHEVPMGIAIIDNVPDSRIEDTIRIFEDNFHSKNIFQEFALLIYESFDKKRNSKPIITKIFPQNNSEIENIEAKFEFVGKYEGDEAAEFIIISY